MFVYSPYKTARLEFVLQILSKRFLIPLTCVSARDDIPEGDAFINYSEVNTKNSLWIIPEGLLWETNIRKNLPETDLKKKTLFPTENKEAYPFDIFSAVFYMLSRYEEYLPFKGDIHGRFTSGDSLAKKLQSVRYPFVDEWIIQLGDTLKSDFGQAISSTNYRYIPTVDVDIAFAYQHRPMWLTLANYFSDLSKLNFKNIKQRFRANVGLDTDPYNTFQLLKETYASSDAHLFFQVGQRGEFDKNISPYHPEMKRLIFKTSQWAKVGLHPSYASNEDNHCLKTEKEILESIISKAVIFSRQHFLKLTIPHTYKKLASLGIKNDFTMGFADDIGFRAGTAHPFPFYDLTEESTTDLLIYPLCIMDGTLKGYLKLNKNEAKKVISDLISEVKKVDGVFVSLWHNTSFSSFENWDEWLDVFTFMHEEARP